MDAKIQELHEQLIQANKMRKMLNIKIMMIGIAETICFIVIIVMLEPSIIRAALQSICFIISIIKVTNGIKQIMKITKQIDNYKIKIERCILNEKTIIQTA